MSPDPNDTLEMFPELYSPAPPPAAMAASGAAMSEIAPGVWVSGAPEWQTPSHIICRVVPSADSPGQYTLVPEGPSPAWIRMTEDVGLRLGVVGLSETTLRRLLWGGYVEHFLGAPGCIYISIESFLDHIRKTRNDQAREISFWTPERRLNWKSTYSGCPHTR